MAGINESNNFGAYQKDMLKIVSENRHRELIETSKEYREAWENYCKAESNGEPPKVKQLYKKKMADIAAKTTIKFTKSKANRDKLIISCLPMVIKLAREVLPIARNPQLLNDIVQAGNIGLILAADKYINTPIPVGKTEAKFSTFAYRYVFKYVRVEAWKLASVFGGDSIHHSMNAKETTKMYEPTRKNSDGDEYTNDTWDDPIFNNMVDDKEIKIISDEVKQIRNASKKLFSVLTKDQKRIMFMAYGIDTPQNIIYTQKEIAKQIGKSEAMVSKTISSCLRKLSHSASVNVLGADLVTSLAQLHGVDISQIPEWSMSDTY